MTKNIIITKKEWFLREIKKILEYYIEYENHDKHYELNNFIEYEGKYEFLIDYIKSDLSEELLDYLTCINGIGGKRDKQIGMIKFVNLFSDFNLKLKDFKIEIDEDNKKIYNFKTSFNFYNYVYDDLIDFFYDFVEINAEKILDEVINFINKK